MTCVWCGVSVVWRFSVYDISGQWLARVCGAVFVAHVCDTISRELCGVHFFFVLGAHTRSRALSLPLSTLHTRVRASRTH